MKRLLGPLLLVALLLGVGTAIYYSVQDMFVQRQAVSLRGLISSDKENFFHDPQVTAALKRGGFEVNVEKAGSRQMATGYDLAGYDFAFPAGAPSAEQISQKRAGSQVYDIFYTPVVIATWKPIADVLVANGVATTSGPYTAFNMEAYLALVAKDARWKDLSSNSVYPVSRSFLITSADARKANSGEMYLALASYALNGNKVLLPGDDLEAILPTLSALFLRQGFTQASTEMPFDDYLSMGMGKAPMVLIYESQFIERSVTPGGGITADMVLMYPSPTIDSKAELVAFNENARRLADFIKDDPELQSLATQHGYRNANQQAFSTYKQAQNLAMVPDQVLNVIDPPSYEMLERIITAIDAQYK